MVVLILGGFEIVPEDCLWRPCDVVSKTARYSQTER